MNTEQTVQIPHSVESEEAVLGSILYAPEALDDLVTFLRPTDFHILRNKYVYEAMLTVYQRSEAVDNLTVSHQLKSDGLLDDVGGSAYLAYLVTATPIPFNTEAYAHLIERAAVRRNLLAASGQIAMAAVDPTIDVTEAADKSIRIIEEVTARRSASFLASGRELVDAALEQYLEWSGGPAEVRGLRSGIPKLDQFIGGFGAGRMYTLYGATGMGKSTLASWIAVNFMEQAPGLIVSTEMDAVFWLQRTVSDLAGVEFRRVESGDTTKAEKDAMIKIYQRLARLRPRFEALRLSDPTPTDIRATVRRLRRQGRCDWVLIDSVNNIRVPGVTDIYPRTSIAADTALSLAFDGLTVLVTSQTGRNSKARANKMPQLNDAEGSGKVEQNSHMVIGIYRHDYYVERGEVKENPAFPKGRTLLSILKNRTGPSGSAIPVQFTPGRGYEYDNRPSTPVNSDTEGGYRDYADR